MQWVALGRERVWLPGGVGPALDGLLKLQGPTTALRQLSVLRWVAVCGQALTVAIVTGPLGIDLPLLPLWGGIGALAIFNVYASWRTRRRLDATPPETFLHLLVDIAALSWLVGWSGGMDNPFSSLFLLPLALAILILPANWLGWVVLVSGAGYGLSTAFGQPLPHIHGAFADAFGLHKAGMLANFAVSAAVMLVFFARLNEARRSSEQEVAQLRERFTRNEGIVALATHAASVAHELNTPLATLTLMVEDLRHEDGKPEHSEDLATMTRLLEVCRDRVRELAAPAQAGEGANHANRVDIERIIERWQLIRPAIDLRRAGSTTGHGSVDPAVGHLLQALLNNAADAGEGVGVARVDLDLVADSDGIHGSIRDYGAGFEQAEPALPSALFQTSKPDGMGIGLALSHATVERFGGQLSMKATEGPGVRVEFFLPAEVPS